MVIFHAWFRVNIILYCQKVIFFQTEQSDVAFIKLKTFHVAIVRKGCFICSAFVLKCTDMCIGEFGQTTLLCSSTVYIKFARSQSLCETMLFFRYNFKSHCLGPNKA